MSTTYFCEPILASNPANTNSSACPPFINNGCPELVQMLLNTIGHIPQQPLAQLNKFRLLLTSQTQFMARQLQVLKEFVNEHVQIRLYVCLLGVILGMS